jgi:outer membrane protein OmpA-like peptidoglycan-associated protein
MMKNWGAIIFFFLLASPMNAQSLDEANMWFNRYEFENAAKSFDLIKNKSVLDANDYQRWCYANFISGNYKESLRMSDSLLKLKKTPPYFYYVNGFSAFTENDFVKAKQAFLNYQKLDTVYFVDSLIVACDELPKWKNCAHILFKNDIDNNDKSDFNGLSNANGTVFFHEGGRDGKKKDMSKDSLDYAEVMFSTPIFVRNKSKNVLKFPLQFNMSNFTSFAIDSSSSEVFITVSQPLSDSSLMQAPHLFTGYIDSTFTVDTLNPWIFSGIEDTSSTAQATLNSKGDLLIFTKQSEKTQNADLYYAKKENKIWSSPLPIKQLNTQGDDMFPLIIGDTLLTFSSNARVGYGGLDIYQAKLDRHFPQFNTIEHLKSPINSFDDDFSLSYLPGAYAAYFSSNRKTQAKGDDDIFFIQFFKPDSSNKEQFEKEWQDIIVYFDFDKFNLDNVAIQELNDVKQYLADWDDLKLEIEGHTDTRGSEAYNLTLGESRAKSVKDFLCQNGFASEDLTSLSKGETDPAVNCSQCSEKEHHLNRFVVIKLKKK